MGREDKRLFQIFLSVAIITLISSFPCQTHAKENVSINSSVVYHELNQTQEKILNLEKQKPKTVVIFWASWCSFCTRFSNKIASEIDAKLLSQFNVISVSIDTDKNEWVKHSKNLFAFADLKVRVVNKNRDIAYYEKIPAVYIFDENGDIDTSFMGFPKNLVSKMNKILKSISEKK